MPARTPPHNLEAEAAVLGAVLIDNEAMVEVSEFLLPEYFYHEGNSLIYAAMIELYEKREPIDAVTLTDRLKKMRKLAVAGGATRIAELSNNSSTAANAQYYGKIVHDLGVKRKLINLSASIGKLAFDDSEELQEIVDQVEEEVFAVSKEHARKDKRYDLFSGWLQ